MGKARIRCRPRRGCIDWRPGRLRDLGLLRLRGQFGAGRIADLREARIRDDGVGRAAGNAWVVDSALHGYEFNLKLTDLI